MEKLEKDIATFFETHTYAIGSKYEPKTSKLILYGTGYRNAPLQEWAIAVGDAVHCLRSALDNAAWQLVLDHLKRSPTEKEAKRIQFPIESTESGFDGAGVRPFVSIDAWELLKSYQPYRRGDKAPRHVLAMLARLSNIDKHRVVHTATVLPQGFDLEVTEMRDVESYEAIEFVIGEPMDENAPVGEITGVATSGSHPYMKMQGPFQARIAFADPNESFHKESVFGVLAAIGTATEVILDEIGQALPNPPTHGESSTEKG